MKSLSLLPLFLICLASSCGKTKAKPESGVYYSPEDSAHSLSQNEKLEDEAFVRLLAIRKLEGTPDKAAEGVGVLVSINANDKKTSRVQFSSCTAALLSNGEVLTSAHCFSAVLRNKKDSCTNVAFVTTKDRRIYRCSHIVWTGSDLVGAAFETYAHPKAGQKVAAIYPDVIIFKLEVVPDNLQPLFLSSTFADKSESLNAWVYTPLPDDKDPKKIKPFQYLFENKADCNLLGRPERGYPFRAFSCKIKKGNSGAPVVDERDRIQGVVGGYNEASSEGYFVDIGCLEKSNSTYRWKRGCYKKGPML